jgi:hypothetical protein
VAQSLSSQGLVDDLELSVDKLAGEWELDSHGRAGRPGGGCHISRRKVKGVVHVLGMMLRQIIRVDDGEMGKAMEMTMAAAVRTRSMQRLRGVSPSVGVASKQSRSRVRHWPTSLIAET